MALLEGDPQPADSMADERVLARWRDGEQEAPSELVKQYLAPVYRYVYRRVRDIDIASEVTQRTFFRFFKRVKEEGFKVKGTGVLGFLYRTASNVLSQYWRERRKQSALVKKLQRVVPIEPEMPSEAAGWAEIKRILTLAILQLPDEISRAVELFYYEGLHYKEIARIMGISMGKAHNLVTEGEERLHRSVGAYLRNRFQRQVGRRRPRDVPAFDEGFQ